ncbi:MAG: PAS domain-containing protein, partial [Lentisphaerae bacterium]|nr:PAS domain-containing protein [Lentisphaerota bacterium]
MKNGFLDKLIERLDKLDSSSLQTQFLRLIKAKGLLQTVFNALQEGIIVLDGQSSIRYANNAAARLLGFTPETAVRQPITRYLRDIDWQQVMNLDEQEWSKLLSREIEIKYPEHKFLHFYVMPIAFPDGTGKGAVVIFRDITQERAKQLQALQSEKLQALTLLAAGVAHEIGNPLNSLDIHLQLMARALRHLPADDRDHFAELIQVSRTEVERINQIITQFLRAIRPATPKLEPCQIMDLLQATLKFMHQEIADRGVAVEVEAPDPITVISVDRDQIKQAFFNLIKNALQAMSQAGLLTITVFSNDRAVGIAFQDTGVGLPPEDLSRLFETHHSTKPQGSGLGLFIVQRIVRDHGGEMEVHSQPQRGTRITLLLPRDQRRIRLLKA